MNATRAELVAYFSEPFMAKWRRAYGDPHTHDTDLLREHVVGDAFFIEWLAAFRGEAVRP